MLLRASLSARMSASASELFKPAAFYGGWPLFCGSECVMDCFASGRFLQRSRAQKVELSSAGWQGAATPITCCSGQL